MGLYWKMMERVLLREDPCFQARCPDSTSATPRSYATAPQRRNWKSSWKGACAMATARWNGVVLAESDHCHMVEGNSYFPPDSVDREYLKPSRAHSLCFWKGLASY